LFDDRLAGTNDRFGPMKDAAVMADEVATVHPGQCATVAAGDALKTVADIAVSESTDSSNSASSTAPVWLGGWAREDSRYVLAEATRQHPLRIAVASQQLAPQSGRLPHFPVGSPA
jgi:hypothetical protein